MLCSTFQLLQLGFVNVVACLCKGEWASEAEGQELLVDVVRDLWMLLLPSLMNKYRVLYVGLEYFCGSKCYLESTS